MMRSPSIWIAGVVLALTSGLIAADGLTARADMPSADEVRDALQTLRRFEQALADGPSALSETGSAGRREFGEGVRTHPEPLTSTSVGVTTSAQIVGAPAGSSLTLEGDLELGGHVFASGTPFIHTDGGAIAGNTAMGLNALVSSSFVPYTEYGSDNSAFGYGVLNQNTSGYRNTASGWASLYANTVGYENTASGWGALTQNVDGSRNSAIGAKSLFANTSGYRNTAAGYAALQANTTGYSNTAVGTQALNSNTSGSFNTAVGFGAGTLWTTGQANVAIGAGALGIGGESGVIRIGGNNYQTKAYVEGVFLQTINSGVPVVINADDQLGTEASSARFKQDIQDLDGISGRLQDLRPVSFRYKNKLSSEAAPNPLEFGLIAEEVAEVFPQLVVSDPSGKPYTVRYHLLTPLLLSELQRQQSTLERRDQEMEVLRSQVADLTRRLDRLQPERRE